MKNARDLVLRRFSLKSSEVNCCWESHIWHALVLNFTRRESSGRKWKIPESFHGDDESGKCIKVNRL